MTEDRSPPWSDGADQPVAHCQKLRALAGWYREFAERAGSPNIWEARLRTAEDLEAEADRAEAQSAAQSPDGLRAEVRRLIDEIKGSPDDRAKRKLAARALALSQRAEALAVWREEPAIIVLNADRYRAMLADGIDDAAQHRLVEEMLADAEAALMLCRLTLK
jgi:hypothetical protein